VRSLRSSDDEWPDHGGAGGGQNLGERLIVFAVKQHGEAFGGGDGRGKGRRSLKQPLDEYSVGLVRGLCPIGANLRRSESDALEGASSWRFGEAMAEGDV
jgi:hypothetical protein